MTGERPTRAASLRIVDLVFMRAVPRPRRTLVVAAVLALAAHGLVAVWAIFHAVAPPLAGPAPDRTIELAEPPPPPPPPAPTPPAPAPVTEPVRTPRPQAARARPPAPAQAGKIIAQDPDPAAPVDLGDQGFVTGTGQTYAGGSTTSSGTNRQAVTSPVVDPRSHDERQPDRSSPVALLDQDWSCPWPHEADDQDIDEQIVVVRVVVRVDGTVVRARLVTDPGRGFGAAATACAERARFVPAHDPAGEPIEATSPPIRVRFTR